MRGMVGLREIILFFGGGGTAILCEFTKLEFCDGLRWMERSAYGDYSLKCFNIKEIISWVTVIMLQFIL